MEITLYKPNELISVISELELNRTARHLFNYFLKFAQRKIKFEDYQDNTFYINYAELNAIANFTPKTIEQTKQSLRTLMRPVVLRDDPQFFEAVVPVTYVTIDKQTGDYVFTLEQRVIELLRNTDYFTKLDLKEFNPLKSKHSIILFEYLKRYENAPKIPLLSINELKQITNTTNKYPNFNDFERFVLKVAITEINDKTQYNVSYECKKTSARTRFKVSEIQFYFSKKERLELENTHESEFNDELFLNFRQIFKNLPIDDYCHACDTFERSTLVRFYNDLKRKDYGTLKTECFLRYLNERTEKRWNGYLFKSYKKTPKEEPGHASGSFGATEKFNFEDYLEKERQKFFDA